MTKAPAAEQMAALQIFAFEARGPNGASVDAAEIALRVCEKLRHLLTGFAGPVGYQSLVMRALNMAKKICPALAPIRVQADGRLDGFSEVQPISSLSGAAVTVNPEIILVAHLLGLLVTFVGESITVTLLNDAWPDVLFGQADQGTEEQS